MLLFKDLLGASLIPLPKLLKPLVNYLLAKRLIRKKYSENAEHAK